MDSSPSAVPSRLRIPTLRRGTSTDTTSPNPGETPVVILRVQVVSCKDLKAVNSDGSSNPFVTVSVLGKQFQTPVCKRSLNPVYEPIDATFDFPIYTSLVHELGMLEFVVWDKDSIGKDYLGECSLLIDSWFKGNAFAFDDRNNQPYSVDLISSRSAKTVHGTIHIKLGFIHPPNSTGLSDFERIYNALTNTVLSPADKGHVGVIMVEIRGVKDLPKWPNMIRTGWDMDPFVQVSINDKVAKTRVIRHSLNPVWDEQLLFHVSEQDLSLPIRLAVFDWDRFTRNDYIGEAKIDVTTLIERAGKGDPNNALYPNYVPTIRDFELPLTPDKKPGRVYEPVPTIIFRAGYRPFDTPRNEVGQGA
ncbi:C2 domain-containing protein [Lactarius vividus]|nr:C2 domain-containing protein [Lactarius vividus]